MGPVSRRQASRIQRRMCLGKMRYCRATARKVAERVRAETAEPIDPYPCPFCGEWHIGHAPPMIHVEQLARYLRFGAVTDAEPARL